MVGCDNRLLNALLANTNNWVFVFDASERIITMSDCVFQGVPIVNHQQPSAHLNDFFVKYGVDCPVVNHQLHSYHSDFQRFQVYWSLQTGSDYNLLVGNMVQQVPILQPMNTLFLHSMAHDICTPISGVINATELLVQESNTESTKQTIELLLACAKQISTQVQQILHYLKIEELPNQIKHKIFNLDNIIETISVIFKPCIVSKELQFEIVNETAPSFLLGDKDKIQRIILNLLSNAINYTESGTIWFEVGVTDKNNKCGLTITVRDTGCGISEEQCSLIFNAFHRNEDVGHVAGGGVGLGLTIVKQFVDILGGTLGVSSVAGQGAEFCVWIPCEIPN